MLDPEKRHVRKKAVALGYNLDRDAAPKVIAKGQGIRAERIVEIARAHGIAIEQDPDLAELLGKLEVNTVIPEELYQAVAEVLALVYRLNRSFEGGLLKDNPRPRI